LAGIKFMKPEILLSVTGLQVHYPVRSGVFLRRTGSVHAVDGVSFEVVKGSTFGLVGESGCGKSTVAKAVLDLIKPTAGEVRFEQRALAELDHGEMRSLRREMQIVLQDPSEALNSRHTVGALLEEPFIIHRMGNATQRRVWVRELLARVGLPENAAGRFPHEFSGGQRQRIGIARAIALQPKLLVCDEAVSALDVSIQSQILNLLLRLQKELGLTLIFIAHDLAVVKHISDRIAVMYLGKIVEIADAETIYRRPLHPYTQSLIAAIPVPDPAVRKPLLALTGEVPSPINPPSGCRFHTRCPFAQEICKREEPLLRQQGDADSDHRTACHFAGEVFVRQSG
jgi:peptide/nickel transport system ATP-binding protein